MKACVYLSIHPQNLLACLLAFDVHPVKWVSAYELSNNKMAMVSADDSSQSFGRLTAQIGWFGLRVGGHPALSLHSSNEPGELWQWLCYDDSTINIVVVIIIVIIIKETMYQTFFKRSAILHRKWRICVFDRQRTMIILGSLVLIELFFARCYGWGATSEYGFKIGNFAPAGAGWPKILGRRGRTPPTILLRKLG